MGIIIKHQFKKHPERCTYLRKLPIGCANMQTKLCETPINEIEDFGIGSSEIIGKGVQQRLSRCTK
jgi:hypothetical protein